MSNFDKAVEIIGELATEYGQPGGDELFGLDEDAALALKENGLLAPDLPEPTPNKYDPDADPYWKVRIKQGDQMTVTSSSCDSICVAGLGTANVTGARTLALALLAAADYAEKSGNK